MVAPNWHPVLQLQAQDFKLAAGAPLELLNQLYNEELKQLVDALADDTLSEVCFAGSPAADQQHLPQQQAWPSRSAPGSAHAMAEGDEGQEQEQQQQLRLLHADFRLSGLDAASAAAAASSTDAARRAQDPHWQALVEVEAEERGERPQRWWGALSSRRLLEVEVPPPAAGSGEGSPRDNHSSGAAGGKAGGGSKGPVLEAYAYESSVEEDAWEGASIASTASSFTAPPFPEDDMRRTTSEAPPPQQGGLRWAAWRLLLLVKALVWDMIPPTCLPRTLWDFCMLALLGYVGCFTPYLVAFDLTSPGLRVWEHVVDALFLTDIALNFRTGYVDARHRLVMGRRKVAVAYLTGWFWVDLAAGLPWDAIVSGNAGLLLMIKGMRVVRLLRVIRLLRMARLLRLVRLALLLRRLKLNLGGPGPRLLLFGVLAALLAHMLACGWVFLAGAWSADYKDTWREAQGMLHSPNSQLYVTSLYWALSTLCTVGFGDVAAQNAAEMVYSCVAIVLGVSVFAYFMGHLALLLASLTSGSSAVTAKLASVDELLRARRVPPSLAQRVHAYFAFAAKRQVDTAHSALLAELSVPLRTELLLFLHRDALERVPFFAGRDPLFIADVVEALQLLHFAPGDVVFHQGDPGNTMFFVAAGRLEVLHAGPTPKPSGSVGGGSGSDSAGTPGQEAGSSSSPVDRETAGQARHSPDTHTHHTHHTHHHHTHHQGGTSHAGSRAPRRGACLSQCRVGVLGPGQHFGEYSVLLAEARTATVVALEPCELYALSRPDLTRVATKWPELGAQFHQLAAGLRHATAPPPSAAAAAEATAAVGREL